MNILHVETGRHHYGGADQVALLMRDLRKRGCRNVLLCCHDAPIAATDAAVVVGKPIAGDLDARLALWVWLAVRRFDIDVVHVHSRRGADAWGGLGARLASVPALVTRRVDNSEHRWSARIKYSLYQRVAVISSAVSDEIYRAGVPAGKVIHVPDAVDSAAFRPEPNRPALRAELGLAPHDLCIGMVAQFIERKGHDDLLDAIPEVVTELPFARFILFGQGPEQARIESNVASAGLSEYVIFAGFRPDMTHVVPALDILVHPARREGLGVAVLQAGACGVPVVAAQAGGIVDVVVDGETGRLVSPGDHAALAAALIATGRDRVGRIKMGNCAREHVCTHFSPEAMGAAYHQTYLQLQ